MKKMLKALMVMCALFFVLPVYSCSQTEGNITGGACSIKELQNLEKNKTSQEKSFFQQSKPERDLRPVRSNPEIRQMPPEGCVFGRCLFKEVLNK